MANGFGVRSGSRPPYGATKPKAGSDVARMATWPRSVASFTSAASHGGADIDTLNGGGGTGSLAGDVGLDLLRGGLGNDTLDVGSGADRFDFNATSEGVDMVSG